jgi:hypothetical protein
MTNIIEVKMTGIRKIFRSRILVTKVDGYELIARAARS